MANYIAKIRTTDGDKQIDYNALANLPDTSQLDTTDKTLIGAINEVNGKLKSFNYITLVDQPTNKNYKLYVSNGTLTMEEDV